MNQIRHENRALHGGWSLRFHEADNAWIIAYSKRTDDGSNTILVVVNLDPFNLQHGWVRAPIADWHVATGQPYRLRDLLTDEQFEWRGEWNYVRLEPGVRPAHIFRLVS